MADTNGECSPESGGAWDWRTESGDGGERPIIARLGGMVNGLACGLDLAGAFVRGPIPRVANGTPHRVDRLRAIGNGQCPAAMQLAWEALT